ncbi:MAG: 6-phosphofructokinase [Anaerolineales bacterium]|nr:6-phosphofructokinase [Anaerolineales bacterium]
MPKRIGLLTGGGDAPGQNVCLKSLVYGALDQGYEVIGIRKGWEGLLYFNPEDPSTHGENTMPLTKLRVRDIDRMAGSFLHSSRVDPAALSFAHTPIFLRTRPSESLLDLTTHVKRVIGALGLDALIVLGDRGTLQYAARLNQEGVPIIGIPKTVHNDVGGSDYALGFSTALARGVRFVQEMRAMAGSREEIAVIEVLGLTTGLTTMLISFLAGADRTLIPEVPFDPERLAELLCEDQRRNPANYAILVMSEASALDPEKVSKYLPELSRLANSRILAEAVQSGGQGLSSDSIVFELVQDLGSRVGGSGAVVTEMLENITGRRMLFQPLSYLIRTGEPDGQDLLGAMNFAMYAIRLFAQNKTGRLIAYRQGENYVDLPLGVVTEAAGNINVADFYDAAEYCAKPEIIWAARV